MNNIGIQRISDVQASSIFETLRADSVCLTSVDYLIYLSNLNLSDTPITQLSASIRGMGSFEVLNLRSCALLMGLLDKIGDLVSLVVLDVTRSGVKELPNTIGNVEGLRKLHANFSKLGKLPIRIGKLQNLEELNVSCSSLQGKVPSGIKRLSSLRTMQLLLTSFSVLPTLPSNLTVFCFGSQVSQVIPDLSYLAKLETLVLPLQNITTLSSDIGNLTLLRDLCLSGCKNLQESNRLPVSLSLLVPSVCPSLRSFPDVSYLQSPSGLFIGVCGITEINGLEKLRGLGCLVIICCWKFRGLPDLSELNNLRVMLMSDCPGIVEIRGRLDRLEAFTSSTAHP